MPRTATIARKTRETDIEITLYLDGAGKMELSTGVGFFDHMLSALAMHGGFDIGGRVAGDLEVDCHHTIEDVGIVLGQAFDAALGDKAGITRFASAYVPMDEALSFAACDISGRPFLAMRGELRDRVIGAFDCEMLEEFWRAFAYNARICLHCELCCGQNGHHMVEALFKACARALRGAVALTGSGVQSTKGTL